MIGLLGQWKKHGGNVPGQNIEGNSNFVIKIVNLLIFQKSLYNIKIHRSIV